MQLSGVLIARSLLQSFFDLCVNFAFVHFLAYGIVTAIYNLAKLYIASHRIAIPFYIMPLDPPGWRYRFIKQPENLRGFSIIGQISPFWRDLINASHLYAFLPHMKGDLLPAAQP